VDGNPAPGVVVSDGYTVAVTDDEGCFSISAAGRGEIPPSSDLIWVCVPEGMRPKGPWYLPADQDELKFDLTCDPTAGQAFSFVYFTDVHLIREREDQPFHQFAGELREMRPAPAFWVCGGDIDLQEGMGDRYCEIMSGTGVPGRQVAGNHDMLVGAPDPWAEYCRQFGPTRYSWDHGAFHFVTLCGLVPNPEGKGWRNVEGELTRAELNWLEADLRHAKGRPTVLFLHIPPLTTYILRRGVLPGHEPAWEVRNADRLLDLCQRYHVLLVLGGHFHENERNEMFGTAYQSTGAVCGQWWERGGRPPLNLDGSPPGYRIVHISGNTLSHHYKAVGQPGSRQLRVVGPRANRPVSGRVPIGVNVFDGDEHTLVEWRIQHGAGETPANPWKRMRLTPQRARPNVLSSAHMWTAWGPGDLQPGTHLLTVRARFRSGEIFTERVSFEVEAGAGAVLEAADSTMAVDDDGET
jgi:3',5'-cyclic-AMP phosphodiesterase